MTEPWDPPRRSPFVEAVVIGFGIIFVVVPWCIGMWWLFRIAVGEPTS